MLSEVVVGCVRNKPQCLTVRLNLKSFPWLLVLRMDATPALDLWHLVINRSVAFFSIRSRTNTPTHTPKRMHGKTETLVSCRKWITLLQTQKLLNSSHSSFFFADNDAMITMIINGRSPTMTHVSRTHRVSFDLGFDRVNLDPKSNMLTPRTNLFTCQQEVVSRMMSGTIFFVCSTSRFPAAIIFRTKMPNTR